MGVLDKFLDIVKLNEDDYDEDEFYEDGEDDIFEEEVEEKPRRSLFNRKPAKEEVEEEYDEPEETPYRASAPAPAASQPAGKVTPMRQPAARRAVAASMEVCVIKPSTVDDSRDITETLLAGRTVILNLEGMDLEIAQRIIDFVSGATYAINGNLQKISNYIFLVTPTGVDISGDLQDLLGGSMEQPSVKGRY